MFRSNVFEGPVTVLAGPSCFTVKGKASTAAEDLKKQYQAPIFAIIGGLHLFDADDARMDWTASELKRLRLAHLVGAHCTGIEALMRLRQGTGLSRKTAVVGAVGASFNLETGIDPGDIAR